MSGEGHSNHRHQPWPAGMTVLFSFVAGLILAILYNIVAVITGGIKVRTTDLYDDI